MRPYERKSTPHRMPIEHESRAAKMLREVFDSGRPLTYIRSAEEQRVARVLREVSLRLASTPTPVWIWSLTDGMHRDGEAAQTGTESARAALDFIAAYKDAAIFHLKDFHEQPVAQSTHCGGTGSRERCHRLRLPSGAPWPGASPNWKPTA